MTGRIWSYIRQYETHRELAGRIRPSAGRLSRTVLDAIVVPASRSAENLEHAIELACGAECQLVVLCSLEAHADEVANFLATQNFTRAVVVDVPPGYHHNIVDFDTARELLPQGCTNPNGDLSAKRNLGLILARMVGWKRIFFLDDDIRKVRRKDLRTTVSMLDNYQCAGMRVEDYPDNSVVCHARRGVGDEQDVFVTGSVLAVDCAVPFNFFPEIYNEDWLFFYDDALTGRLGGSGCRATQLPYDPFGNPRRARQQEFGDILAEGLYALLHQGVGPEHATRDYWKKFLHARWSLLSALQERAEDSGHKEMHGALESATWSLIYIEPKMCEDYVLTWRSDLLRWREALPLVPRVDSVDVALDLLDLKRAPFIRREFKSHFQPVRARIARGAALNPSPDIVTPSILPDSIGSGRAQCDKV